MPTYEYACKKCGQTVEVFQSFSDKPLKTHKDCGGALQKVFHARGIVFKGGGFYATDSKSSSSSKPTGDSTGADKPDKPDKKSDSKKSDKTSAKASTSSKPAGDAD